MQVTIIFEDLKFLSSLQPKPAKKDAVRNLRLKISCRLQVYLLCLVVALLLLAFKLPIVSLIVAGLSTMVFGVLNYLHNAFNIDIKFCEQDGLDELVKEEVIDY